MLIFSKDFPPYAEFFILNNGISIRSHRFGDSSRFLPYNLEEDSIQDIELSFSINCRGIIVFCSRIDTCQDIPFSERCHDIPDYTLFTIHHKWKKFYVEHENPRSIFVKDYDWNAPEIVKFPDLDGQPSTPNCCEFRFEDFDRLYYNWEFLAFLSDTLLALAAIITGHFPTTNVFNMLKENCDPFIISFLQKLDCPTFSDDRISQLIDDHVLQQGLYNIHPHRIAILKKDDEFLIPTQEEIELYNRNKKEIYEYPEIERTQPRHISSEIDSILQIIAGIATYLHLPIKEFHKHPILINATAIMKEENEQAELGSFRAIQYPELEYLTKRLIEYYDHLCNWEINPTRIIKLIRKYGGSAFEYYCQLLNYTWRTPPPDPPADKKHLRPTVMEIELYRKNYPEMAKWPSRDSDVDFNKMFRLIAYATAFLHISVKYNFTPIVKPLKNERLNECVSFMEKLNISYS